jgi:hypothetical protein
MNIVSIVKCVLIGLCFQNVAISSVSSYDKFHNKGLSTNINYNHPYFTSNVFHSIEYASKNSNTNTNKKNLKLRKMQFNVTKSLPNIIL